MSRRTVIAGAVVAALAATAWWSQLVSVARPPQRPRALALLPVAERRAASFDVVLPAVPVGAQRLSAGSGPLLIHYWAPWEHHGREQAALLDSLRREPGLEGLRVVIVCFDPFPSVTRFVARQRLRLGVLIDAEGELRRALPCPSVPYTYGIDAGGAIALAQAGEADWWAEGTRQALLDLLAAPGPARRRAAARDRPS